MQIYLLADVKHICGSEQTDLLWDKNASVNTGITWLSDIGTEGTLLKPFFLNLRIFPNTTPILHDILFKSLEYQLCKHRIRDKQLIYFQSKQCLPSVKEACDPPLSLNTDRLIKKAASESSWSAFKSTLSCIF